jgi:thiol-disulfide isomerase/thioredoxin
MLMKFEAGLMLTRRIQGAIPMAPLFPDEWKIPHQGAPRPEEQGPERSRGSVWTLCFAALVLFALPGCGDPSDDDDSIEMPIQQYGPVNDWIHATMADVPDDLEGTGRDVGEIAFDFMLSDQFGYDVQLYQFYGHPIVLDLVAMWCGPCEDQAAGGQALWDEFGDQGLIYAALLEDNAGYEEPSLADAEDWVSTYELTHPVLVDTTQSQIGYLIDSAWPTYILIDAEMNIVDASNAPFVGADIEPLLQ